MSIYTKLIAFFGILIAIFSLLIGIFAYRYATDVTSWQIRDNTITEKDFSDDLKVKLVLENGQTINANIVKPDTVIMGNIKGINTTEDGYVRIITKDNELVFDPMSIILTDDNFKDDSITGSKIKDNSLNGLDIIDYTIQTTDLADSSINSQKIQDGSLGLNDVNFKVLSSINGIFRNGQNIDIIGSNGIDVINDYQNGKIFLNLKSQIIPGTFTNADTLDNLDSTYFLDLGNIQKGTLQDQFYSAYSDLFAEGKLNYDADGDLITKAMLENYNLSFKEAIVRNNLAVKGDLTVDGDLLFSGAIGYNNLILSPKSGEFAIQVVKDSVNQFTIDSLGNLVANGNINLKGTLETANFKDLDATLINALNQMDAQDRKINDISKKLSDLSEIVRDNESNTISGSVNCLPTSADIEERCEVNAPQNRTFKSIVFSAQNSYRPVFGYLKKTPFGENSAEVFIYSATGVPTFHTKLFYVATLND